MRNFKKKINPTLKKPKPKKLGPKIFEIYLIKLNYTKIK